MGKLEGGRLGKGPWLIQLVTKYPKRRKSMGNAVIILRSPRFFPPPGGPSGARTGPCFARRCSRAKARAAWARVLPGEGAFRAQV